MNRLTSLTPLVVLIPLTLAAQESSLDTAGFRAGQWGVQVGTSGSLMNVGILHFSSPRSAWLLRVDFFGQFLNGSQTTLGTTSDANERLVEVGLGVGKRFYQAPRHKVRSFQSIGVAGSYLDQKQNLGGSPFTFSTWSAGPFAEVGAGFWITPNLSLGATATANAGYSHRKNDSPSNTLSENGWFVSGVNVFLVVGLYF